MFVLKNNIIPIFIIVILSCICFVFFKSNVYSPYSDIGRELYIVQQMLNGEVLYKDIFNVYAPLGYQINALISYLEYISRGDRDEYEACRRIRLFLRDEYFAGRLTNARCAEIMYTVSVYNSGFDDPVWQDMYYLSDVYDYAEIGVCTMQHFEELLTRYLETGEYLKLLN